MLQKALKATSEQITERLTCEIRELGQCTADPKTHVDDMELTINDQTQQLEALRNKKKMLLSRIKDAENCSHRSNLRIRGITESIDDLTSFTTDLFQELFPPIHIECLEFDWIHWALTGQFPKGPPCNIIINLHFYHTKEQLLLAAHSKDQLQLQDHTYQIFSDLAPFTVVKHRSMKTQLQILQLKYTWKFPFAL